MTEQLRENYFLAVRTLLLLALEIYIALSRYISAGASYGMLFLLALFLGTVAGRELINTEGKKWVFFGISVILFLIMFFGFGKEFLLLGIFLCYELITCFKPGILWYVLPLILSCLSDKSGVLVQMMFTLFLGVIYFQNDFIYESYRKQTKEDIVLEQDLKHDIFIKEYEMKQERKRGLLLAENQILEERAKLSQTLHDKLGHNINGSVYQLEAVKVLMEQKPEQAKEMIQAVIGQLRSGMDEIRMILRRQRPKKYRVAVLSLEKLCEECRQKGVQASLVTTGDVSAVPEEYLEIILDNAYEAVSNSLKYAGCTKIDMAIHVLNKMVRCSISDNGNGCKEIADGMGISGMRQRMREVNGILSFETQAGFTVNMLLPL